MTWTPPRLMAAEIDVHVAHLLRDGKPVAYVEGIGARWAARVAGTGRLLGEGDETQARLAAECYAAGMDGDA